MIASGAALAGEADSRLPPSGNAIGEAMTPPLANGTGSAVAEQPGDAAAEAPR